MSNTFPQPIDFSSINPNTGGAQALPLGSYDVRIVSTEVKANSKNTGGLAVLNLEVLNGEHKGTVGSWQLNVFHSNDTAQRIAREHLAGVASCCEIAPQAISQSLAPLNNREFHINVVPDGERTKPASWTKKTGTSAAAAPTQPQTQSAPQSAAFGQPPAQAEAVPQSSPFGQPPAQEPAPAQAAQQTNPFGGGGFFGQ